MLVIGCTDVSNVSIASFDTADSANKVSVLLYKNNISADIVEDNDKYSIFVGEENEIKARELLSKFNFYFLEIEINDLLESKFASLSKLEEVKSNLLESRIIFNKLSVLPDVLRTSVVVTGRENKKISVIIASFENLEEENKANIEGFLRGLISKSDQLTVSYVVPQGYNQNDLESEGNI